MSNEKANASEAPAAGLALHTPAPWRTSGGFTVIRDTHLRKIAHVKRNHGEGAAAERDANAKLIAAAPALADALEALLRAVAISTPARDTIAFNVVHAARTALLVAGRIAAPAAPKEPQP